MKKQRQRFSSVLKILLILLLISMISIVGVFTWNLLSKKPDIDDVEDPDDSIQTFEFEIEDYTYFKIEELSYDFILAEITVNSNKKINLSLSHFVTQESISLNSVDNFLNELEGLGWTLGRQDVVFNLSSDSTQLSAVVFIPIQERNLDKFLININLNPKSELNFDLTDVSKIGSKEMLGFTEQGLTPEQVAEIDVLFKSTVSPSDFYQLDANGQKIEASFTSQSQIIGIKLSIKNKLSEDFRITDARIKTKSGEFFDALNKNYLVEGVNNINNTYINGEMTGYLFFEVLGNDLTVDSFDIAEVYISALESDQFYRVDLSGGQ